MFFRQIGGDHGEITEATAAATGEQRRQARGPVLSTGGQTTANQRRELEGVAKRHGWKVERVFSDNGISGAKDRKERPGLNGLQKAVAVARSTWWLPGPLIVCGGR